MSSKQIARHLKQVLLGDKEMDRRLYELRLEDLVDDLVVYLADGNEDCIFALAEDEWDVAMLLIESNGQIHINEHARDRLREIWSDAYERKFRQFLPEMVEELVEFEIPYVAVNARR